MSERGSVYWREKDQRWVGKLQLPKDPLTNKPQKPKYVYSSLEGRKGKQEVERKLNKLIEQIDSGNFSEINKLTIKGWLEKYLQVYCQEKATTTKEGYKRYIDNHINPIIGNIFLKELLPIQLKNFYNKEREKGYSEKTILQEHRILHRAFKLAVADGKLSRNPCDFVDAPSPDDYEPTIYTEEQYINLLDRLYGHKMEAIILIAGMCGLRRGELLGLTWEDIDLENGIISIKNTIVPTNGGNKEKKEPKTKKSKREFAIPSVIIPRLKQLRGIGHLLLKQDGKMYHPGSVSREFKDFLKKNNLPHIRLHDLRHFNITMMLKHGISSREAMERSGHSNINMITKYQHILKEMDKQSANKLNNVFGVKNGVKQKSVSGSKS